MGAWGSGPFDNDEALDFLGELDRRRVLRALKRVPKSRDLELYQAQTIVAALEVVAAARGRPAAGMPDEALSWANAKGSLLAKEKALALAALDRVREARELDASWGSAKDRAAWRRSLEALRGRLLGAIVPAAKRKAPPQPKVAAPRGATKPIQRDRRSEDDPYQAGDVIRVRLEDGSFLLLRGYAQQHSPAPQFELLDFHGRRLPRDLRSLPGRLSRGKSPTGILRTTMSVRRLEGGTLVAQGLPLFPAQPFHRPREDDEYGHRGNAETLAKLHAESRPWTDEDVRQAEQHLPRHLWAKACPRCGDRPNVRTESYDCSCGATYRPFLTDGRCEACGKKHARLACAEPPYVCSLASPLAGWNVEPLPADLAGT